MSKRSSAPKKSSPFPTWLLSQRNQGLLLALLAFLIYANSIPNEYALDDQIVIEKNKYTQDGISGLGGIFTSDPIDVYFNRDKNLVQGGRYRPLSLATFAIEVEFFGENPHVSHFLNVLIFAISILVLFQLLSMLWPPGSGTEWYASSAFLITLLFATHPIHTEAVANIKGRDELLALLFSLLAFQQFMVYYDSKKTTALFLGAATFFLALLSKESALPLIAVLPFAPWFFRKASLKSLAVPGLVLFLLTAAYIAMRASFVGWGTGGQATEILNDPFLNASFGERMATISHTLGLYLWKMLFPHPLSHDYYPWQIPISNWSDWKAILPALVYLTMAAGMVWAFIKRKKSAFGLLWYFATLSIVSNIFVSIGTTMGERFVFIPSLGFLMFVIWGLEEGAVAQKRLSMKSLSLGLAALALIFAVLTILRNPVWKDDFTLFTTDVEASPNSAKLRTSAGGALIEFGDSLPPGREQTNAYREAVSHLEASLGIYPDHGQTWLLLGNAYYKLQNPQKAIESFQQAIAYRPGLKDAYRNAAVVAGESNMPLLAAQYFREVIRFEPAEPELWFSRALNFEKAGQADSAIFAYQRCIKLNPNKWEAIGNMALVYGRDKGDFQKSIQYGEQALRVHSKAEWLYDNLGIAYSISGQPQKAIEVLMQGLEQFPRSAKMHMNVATTFNVMGDTAQAALYRSKALELNPNLLSQ